MRHRIYTFEEAVPNESNLLNALLEEGVPWLHLRKPKYTLEQLETLLTSMDPIYHPRIILHQHWELAEYYAVGGLHWTEWHRRQYAPVDFDRLVARQQRQGWQVGTAVHHTLTLDQLPPYLDYATASPLFPSISKPGYRPSFDWQLRQAYPFTVVGLGGIQADNLKRAYARGFREIIFLGAIWKDPERAVPNYKRLCNIMQQLGPAS